MANVKHTTNNDEMLTTNCKKVATALKRFAEFLGNYDRCYNDMLNNIKSANDNNTTTFTDDFYNTITMTLTVNDNNDSYTLTIKHTHNAPKTIWCICTQDGTIKDFDDRKELFKYAYDNNLYGDFDDIWIEEKELKDVRFDYYETVDYEELDLYKIRTCIELDICDMKTDNTNNTNDNDVTDLIEYNIDDINNGLKNDCYKKVREGIERICSIITDDMKVCIDLHNGNNVNYCTITSTDNKGYYGFKYVKSTYIKKPSDFARWLYFKTFVRSIELKCWYHDELKKNV